MASPDAADAADPAAQPHASDAADAAHATDAAAAPASADDAARQASEAAQQPAGQGLRPDRLQPGMVGAIIEQVGYLFSRFFSQTFTTIILRVPRTISAKSNTKRTLPLSDLTRVTE